MTKSTRMRCACALALAVLCNSWVLAQSGSQVRVANPADGLDQAFELIKSTNPADQRRALMLFEKAANAGVASAQITVAYSYLQDASATGDFSKLLPWVEAAAAQGDPNALYMLSEMYSSGRGVTRSEEQARDLMLRAANLHQPWALRGASHMLLRDGPVQDVRRGLAYLQESAQTGDPVGMVQLGLLLYAGANIQRDYAAAFSWFERASSTYPPARLWMAQSYALGRGVPADLSRAEQQFAELQKSLPPDALNNFAWALAVSPDDSSRDAARAVAIMTTMFKEHPETRTTIHLDTLAAAYAANGQFDAAQATQRETIRRANAAERDRMLQRLKLYERGRAYRELP